MNKVKVNSDVELKDRLVAINRVTKVTRVVAPLLSQPLSLLVTATASSDVALERLVR